MTLLTTTFAAVICTLIWYKKSPHDEMKVSILCFMYWGASIMWLVDAIYEYSELKANYFTPKSGDMLNDFYLGLSVIALGLVVWLVILLIKDPQDKVKAVLSKKL